MYIKNPQYMYWMFGSVEKQIQKLYQFKFWLKNILILWSRGLFCVLLMIYSFFYTKKGLIHYFPFSLRMKILSHFQGARLRRQRGWVKQTFQSKRNQVIENNVQNKNSTRVVRHHISIKTHWVKHNRKTLKKRIINLHFPLTSLSWVWQNRRS